MTASSEFGSTSESYSSLLEIASTSCNDGGKTALYSSLMEETFAARLKRIMEKTGRTNQSELARHCGVTGVMAKGFGWL